MLWRAIEMARQHDSGGRVRVVALALDKRGRVISVGKNCYTRSHPIAKRFAQKHHLPERDRLHAELKAVIAARGQVINTLVVARVDRDGNVCDGKPCFLCSDMLKWAEEVQGKKIDVVYSKGETNGIA